MKNLISLIIVSALLSPILGHSSVMRGETSFQEGVQLRKRKLYAEAHDKFVSVSCSHDANLAIRAMHNLGAISFHQKLYDEAKIWFQNANSHSIEHFEKPFKPSVRNLQTINEYHLLDSPDNLGPNDIKWNWTKRFQLLNGNFIEHRWKRIILSEGFGDLPGRTPPQSHIQTNEIIALPTTKLAGNRLEKMLVLSCYYSEEEFENALFKSGIYNGEYSFEKEINKFSYNLNPFS